MALFAIADPHLSFSTDKPMDIFGRNWENHAEKLRENWLSAVSDGDTVVIPGDISWAMGLDNVEADLRFIDGLPGRKLIGKGNHDYWWDTVTKMNRFCEEKGFSTISFLFNNAYLVDDKIICGTRGWIDEIGVKKDDERIIKREAQRLEMSLAEGERLKEENPEAELLVFLHYPPIFGSFMNDDIMNVLYRHNVERVFYGHLHGVSKSQLDEEFYGMSLTLVASDYLSFCPMRIE